MLQRIKAILKERQHYIVLTILTVYLCALAVKTGQVFYTDYWSHKAPAEQTADANK